MGMQAIDTTRETTYAVQIRYRGGEWITLTQIGDRMAAVRRAASAYCSAAAPDGRLPTQVRLLAA
jgi:hypothetical protein